MGVLSAIGAGARAEAVAARAEVLAARAESVAERTTAKATARAAESAAEKTAPVLESVPRERGGGYRENADRMGYGRAAVITAASGATVGMVATGYGIYKADHIMNALENGASNTASTLADLAKALEEKGSDLGNGVAHAFDGLHPPSMPVMPSVGATTVGMSIVVLLAGVSVIYLIMR